MSCPFINRNKETSIPTGTEVRIHPSSKIALVNGSKLYAQQNKTSLIEESLNGNVEEFLNVSEAEMLTDQIIVKKKCSVGVAAICPLLFV